MRRSIKTGLFAACAMGVALSGCTLVSPGCRNLDVKASLGQDARNALRAFIDATGKNADRELQRTTFELKDAYETSASGDTRACSAKMMVGDSTAHVAVPVEYQVIKGESGQALYRWDADAFGRDFLAQAVTKALTMPAQTSSPPDSETPPAAAEAPAASPQPSTGDDVPAKQASLVRPQDSGWGDLVKRKILAQASTVAAPSSGSVVVSFDVSAEGDFSNVRVVHGSGNSDLDAAAVRIVEQTGHIDSLYGERVVGFTMKLSFL